MNQLSHVDEYGDVNMVDVSHKNVTQRGATATGTISMSADAFAQVTTAQNKKGDVLTIAKIAGIQGAKQCATLIPLCHPLALSKVDVEITPEPQHTRFHVTATCKVNANTGVEMEALTAVQVALLTLFDMCKAADPAMIISNVRVLQKTGGKNGHWQSTKSDIV